LIIFDIYPFNDTTYTEKLNKDFRDYLPISIENPYYIKINITLEDFFSSENIDYLTSNKIKNFENDNTCNHSIFIFNSLPLPFIIAAFKMQNILLTAGSKNKRGVLSPVHHRLSQFNTCLEGIKKVTITESYHNYDALAIQPIFQHEKTDNIKNFIKINDFFIFLQQYYKIKINSINSEQQFNLRKDKDLNRDFNEFLEFCKSHKNNLTPKP
jgi:hypothetical protein